MISRIMFQFCFWEFRSLLVGLVKGKYPRSVSRHILKQRTQNPQTLNEKILYRMLHDRNEILQIFGSKARTRGYLEALGLSQYLPRLIWSGKDMFGLSKAIETESNFVLKPDCGSGATMIVSDFVSNAKPKDISFFDNPWGLYVYISERIEPIKIMSICEAWQRKRYGFRKDAFAEWAYEDGSRTVLMEELMIASGDQIPSDYKFFVFEGKCHFIQVDYNRFFSHKRAFYTRDWERLDLSCIYPQADFDEEKPKLLDEMLLVSETISRNLDFLRVDLYITDSGIKFGECTLYPGGGIDQFDPADLSEKYASLWLQKY
jgi:hypothetical protein